MRNLVLFTSIFATTTLAQSTQGVLSFGNIPQCGNQCGVLSSAATECGGGSSSSQAIWACFCQRVYSANPTAIVSGTGLCTDTCSSTSDQSATIDWFRSQCGDDNGASEHADSGSGSGGTNTQSSTASTSSSTGSTTSASGNGGSGASTDGNGILGENPSTEDWWSRHWKWIVMLIALAVGLSLIGIGAVWYKKRRQRRADRINGSFNQGITSRSNNQNYGGEMNGPYGPDAGGKGIASGSLVEVNDSGKDSPMRTRDAFMPYGYGYTRSESRLASRGNVAAASPGTADATMAGTDEISSVGTDSPYAVGGASDSRKKDSRKVLVRERSS
ncbi:hypothetical protein K431DRAFT_227400 [Polychaeton citri CBS 116435]|uniref:Integral membrane protein n=1 Tax=Polychaeton citri CBS 116435 TaxID=1314669 RepID=A0A9P4Q665_9PEZI|nr:hypothetical protein K431DRAFT_227400 [Polychaeton citri CBS 116435]